MQQRQEEFEQATMPWTEEGATSVTASSVPAATPATDRSVLDIGDAYYPRPTSPSTVPSEFICALTLDIMKYPAMDRNGHTYEKRAILEWLERGHEVCPLTRKPLRLSDIIPNRSLQCRIEEWRRNHGEDLTDTEEDEEEFERPFVGIINLPLELQGKMGGMESGLGMRRSRDLESPHWDTHHRGYPIVFYYIPEDDHLLNLLQDTDAQQRLAEECIAEERCLAMTYVGLLCSLFLLFGIVIFILYQLLLDANDI